MHNIDPLYRHEEFNKRGMSVLQIEDAKDFQIAFALVDELTELEKKCMDDYGVQTESDKHYYNTVDTEYKVHQMRILLRNKRYLSEPEKIAPRRSLGGEEMDQSFLNIMTTAKNKRRDNVLKMIQSNSLLCSLKSSKVNVFKTKKENIDHNEHIKILIASEQNEEARMNLFNHWRNAKKDRNYDPEVYIENILSKNFCV